MEEKLFRSSDQENSSRRCVWVNGTVIVGAGPSGLATAVRLRERGVPSIVLERADCIASVWQKRTYDRLKLHLSKQFRQLPKLPFPDDFPEYPTKRQYTEYLESYANKFQIYPRFNECVQSARYDHTVGLWSVKTVSGSTSSTHNEVEYISRWLVNATGENAVCVKPEIEGLSEFKGDVIHACDYKSGKSFRGKKVLVVGCGNSAMEISLDLCNHKALPSMVVSSSVHVLPREILGKSTFELAILMLRWLPLWLVDKLLLIMAWSVLGNMDKYGLKRPSMGPLKLMSTKGKTPVFNTGTLEKIRSGDIKVVPGIKRLNNGKAELVNGEKLDIDAVVHATGYRNYKKELVCNEELLEGQGLIDHICSEYNDAMGHHFVIKKRAKVWRRPLEVSIVATDLTDKKKNDDSGNSCRRKSEVGEEEDTIGKSDVIQKFVPGKPHRSDFILESITVINPKIESTSMIWNMINSTYDGLASEHCPIISGEGEGGAYFMRDSTGQTKVSVFKPTDEEPKAVNNPRGRDRHPLSSDGEGLKKGTRVGQGAFMEVAAYVLDHPISGRRKSFSDEKGFAGVPPTLMVKCLHKGFNHPGDLTAKIGSMQMFVENDGSCGDFGPGVFPVKEVHKITVLDIRLANADRHAGNILFSRKKENDQSVMIPIDHGYCLPTCFEDCTFEWLYWPQARQQYSLEAVEYIKSLDAEEDIALLNCRVWDLPTECARTLKISTMLLKKGVERGLTPFAIGSLMCRESLNKKSVIEEIVQVALDSVRPDTSETTLLDAVSQIMDRRLDDIFGSLLMTTKQQKMTISVPFEDQ